MTRPPLRPVSAARRVGVAEKNRQTYHENQLGSLAEAEAALAPALVRARHASQQADVDALTAALEHIATMKDRHATRARAARRARLVLIARTEEQEARQS